MDDVTACHFNRFGSTDTYSTSNCVISYTKNGLPNGSSTTPGAYQDRFRSFFFGTDIGRYNFKKKTGQLLPLTPFRRLKTVATARGMLDLKLVSGVNTYTAKANFWPASPPFIEDSEIISKIAPFDDYIYLQNAISKLSSATHDTLTFLAEFGQVKKMFAHMAKKMQYLLLDVPSDPSKVSEKWLVWRYGYRPLIKDCEDLSEAIASASFELKRLKERSGCGFHTESTSTAGPYAEVYNTFSVVTTDYVDVSIRGTAICDVWFSPLQFNPFVTAWEIIPFSFIVDWLLGVGKWISAVSNLSISTNWALATGAKVTILRSRRERVLSWPSGGSGTRTSDGECQSEFILRKPANTNALRFPRFNLRIDGSKVADLIAILAQLTSLKFNLRGN